MKYFLINLAWYSFDNRKLINPSQMKLLGLSPGWTLDVITIVLFLKPFTSVGPGSVINNKSTFLYIKK